MPSGFSASPFVPSILYLSIFDSLIDLCQLFDDSCAICFAVEINLLGLSAHKR